MPSRPRCSCCARACRRGWTADRARAEPSGARTAMPTGTASRRSCRRWWPTATCRAARCRACSIPSASTCCARWSSSAGFGDVELWEVVHRAQWQRCAFGHALYRHGEEGNSFHIIAQGQVEVYRDGQRVAQLGAGTSVGEMAYLAPSPALRIHSADVIVSEPATTISFTPQTAGAAEPGHAPPVRRRLHPRAGAPAACRARGAGASAAHPVMRAVRGGCAAASWFNARRRRRRP